MCYKYNRSDHINNLINSIVAKINATTQYVVVIRIYRLSMTSIFNSSFANCHVQIYATLSAIQKQVVHQQ